MTPTQLTRFLLRAMRQLPKARGWKASHHERSFQSENISLHRFNADAAQEGRVQVARKPPCNGYRRLSVLWTTDKRSVVLRQTPVAQPVEEALKQNYRRRQFWFGDRRGVRGCIAMSVRSPLAKLEHETQRGDDRGKLQAISLWQVGASQHLLQLPRRTPEMSGSTCRWDRPPPSTRCRCTSAYARRPQPAGCRGASTSGRQRSAYTRRHA